MKLKDLMKDIKTKFHIDQELRAYLYKDKIEFIDFTSVTSKCDKRPKEFYGYLFTIYIEDNLIKSIDNQSMQLITKNNKDCIAYLLNLIGMEIEGYQYYPKLKEIEDLSYEKV